MKEETDNYKKIIKLLRKQWQDPDRGHEIEEAVMNKIEGIRRESNRITDFIESLFGWTHIGWIRGSLVGVATIMVAVFIYQQAIILKQVKEISKQAMHIGKEPVGISPEDLNKKLTLFKISSGLTTGREIVISEERLEEILESYNDLQTKFEMIMKIIEEDPALKKEIEERLVKEKNHNPDI